MNPGSLGVSSDTLAWETQLGLTVPSLSPSSALHYDSPLLIHLEAFYAASLIFLVAFLSCNPRIPRRLNVQCKDWPGNALLPTSISSQVLQLFVLQAAQGICLGILPWPPGLSAARFALRTSAASPGSPTAASHKLRITAQWGPLCVRWCSDLLGTGVCSAGLETGLNLAGHSRHADVFVSPQQFPWYSAGSREKQSVNNNQLKS